MEEFPEEDEWSDESATCANTDPEEVATNRRRAQTFADAIKSTMRKFDKAFRKLAEN